MSDDASDVPGERRRDEVPQPLPFPTCVRKFPRGGGAGRRDALDSIDAANALDALDQASLSFAKFLRILEEERRRAELEGRDGPSNDDGPRAA